MRSLARVATQRSPSGQPIPAVFAVLDQAGVRPRRGNVTLLAASGGSGKTLLLSKWVLAAGLPTLYFSADTDEATMAKRFAAMVTGDPQDVVEQGLRSSGAGFYADELEESVSHIKFVFESDPTYKDLEMETAAFAEVHGAFPDVIVVDTLMNLVGETDDEWAGFRDHTKALKRLTRVTNASVWGLHHTSETSNDQSYPPPRNAVQGKISQLPELILTLSNSLGEGVMRVAAVKNRNGPQDPSGKTYSEIFIDPSTVQFYETETARLMERAI